MWLLFNEPIYTFCASSLFFSKYFQRLFLVHLYVIFILVPAAPRFSPCFFFLYLSANNDEKEGHKAERFNAFETRTLNGLWGLRVGGLIENVTYYGLPIRYCHSLFLLHVYLYVIDLFDNTEKSYQWPIESIVLHRKLVLLVE